MSERLLIAWVAATDYRAARGEPGVGVGPVAQALTKGDFAGAVLLNNYPTDDAAAYLRWLRPQIDVPVRIHPIALQSPVDYAEIYTVVCEALEQIQRRDPRPLAFHLSPGTPAMAAVWLLLSQTRFPASLVQSSRQDGLVEVTLPFDIAVDFLPGVLAERDRRLRDRAAEPPPLSPAFDQILHRSPEMAAALRRARRAATRDVPVLIEGESGVGKELLARAIHSESRRSGGPFVAVNCGAIPPELVESELFGHERGAFTGAARARLGYFRAADGGTLFLDEVGELPLAAQVKLLRALQEREVTPVGGSRPARFDVRVVAATHRRLLAECAAERFRFDLFYRLAVAVLVLPPLRERAGDLSLLVEAILAEQAAEARRLGEPAPTLSAGAVRALQRHTWPGNVRELRNTLRRACLWSEGGPIGEQEMQRAILRPPAPGGDDALLGRPIEGGVDLQALMAEVARHYLPRALAASGGNKTEAARLLGLPSYQTLGNWMKRYGVDG